MTKNSNKKNIYVLKDDLTGFLDPFFQTASENHAVVTRDLKEIINTFGTELNKKYKDISLFLLGTYNSDDASMSLLKKPEMITRLISLYDGSDTKLTPEIIAKMKEIFQENIAMVLNGKKG